MIKYFSYVLLTIFLMTSILEVEAKAPQTQKKKIEFTQNGVSHIKDRHWHNANSGPNTSHFNRSMTVNKLHALAVKTIKNGQTSKSKNGQGRKVHEYTFKKPIGTTGNGQKAKTLRVVTSPKGEIITAFPVK